MENEQMGSTMKPTIFNDRVAAALRNWHQSAKKNVKQNRGSLSVTPTSSRPMSPLSQHMSPVHLLRYYRGEVDSMQTSPRRSNFADSETESPSPSYHHPKTNQDYDYDHESSSFHHQIEMGHLSPDNEALGPQMGPKQHGIDIGQSKEFSFDKRAILYSKEDP